MLSRRLMPTRRIAWSLLACLNAGASRAEDVAPGGSKEAAVQVMADLTLIDGSCHGEAVNFGVGFGFLARQGLSASSILPGGSERVAFERDMQVRRASFDREALCGEIADNYAQALPGSVTGSPGGSRGR